MILGLWGISFHAVVVSGLGVGKDLLFKSVLGHCVKPKLSLTESKADVLELKYLLVKKLLVNNSV